MSKTDYRIKRINGCHGYYWNGQIVLSRKLTEKNIPSKRFVYLHEVMHKYLHLHNIKLSPAREEKVCDIYALFRCKSYQLSYLECQFKKVLIKRYGKKPSMNTIIKMDINLDPIPQKKAK